MGQGHLEFVNMQTYLSTQLDSLLWKIVLYTYIYICVSVRIFT